MKKFVLGLIIGTVISTTSFAAVQEYILKPASYNVVADGMPLNDPELPILNYNGTTYLSLKKTAEAVNADLSWNDEKKQAEINTNTELNIETSKLPASSSAILIENTQKLIKNSPEPIIDKKVEESMEQYWIKSNIYEPDKLRKYPLLIVNDEEYLQVNVIGHSKNIGNEFFVQLPGKNPVKVQIDSGSNAQATENSIRKNGYTWVKLSALGLKTRIEGDTLWLEWQ